MKIECIKNRDVKLKMIKNEEKQQKYFHENQKYHIKRLLLGVDENSRMLEKECGWPLAGPPALGGAKAGWTVASNRP